MNKIIALAAVLSLTTGASALAEERATINGAYSAPSKSSGDIQLKSAPVKENAVDGSLQRIKGDLESLSKKGATKKSQKAALIKARTEAASLLKILSEMDSQDPGVEDARASVAELRAKLNGALKDLEAEDKLGNFEIQRLMSQYNQSEQLASSVKKKMDDTANAVIGKV